MFAAYSGEASKPYVTADEIKFTEDLFSFSSYQNVLASTSETTEQNVEDNSLSSDSFDSEHKARRRKRKKKSKRIKTKDQTPIEVETCSDIFQIDTKRTPELLTVNRIHRPSAPRYNVSHYFFPDRKQRRKKFKRYFKIDFAINENKSEDESSNTITRDDLKKSVTTGTDEFFKGFKHEEDLTKTTAEFNKALQEDPSDIEKWLSYINFQDVVFQFEKTYRKGSIAKGLRVTAERKLAILDKALSYNPNCEKLLRERLNIAVSIYPADELQNQLKKLVEKDQGNIILWQGFIESKQCSMSHCSTPKVLELYARCLSSLHKLRRSAKIEKSVLEEYILRMLYQCGLFLRQAGLFEQLWTLAKLYLELNLSQKDFSIPVNFDEKQLMELEDVVLNSQLPIHELWLRIEKLRESVHWLPYSGSENCEDPQRLVFSEDVAELIHPITMPGNTFKLVTTILSLLKVPLLPCRHTTMSELGLDYVPWALDNVETLLSVFQPMYPVDIGNDLLKYTQRLAVGPQYLKTLPCQEEYLEFILKVMQNCTESLNGTEKMAGTIWWMRFIRLLVTLEKDETFKTSEAFRKRIKGNIKKLLKKDEFRNSVTVFCEYALFENVSDHFEQAKGILLTTIEVNFKSKTIATVGDENRNNFCLVFRTLIEIILSSNNSDKNNRETILKFLIQFSLGSEVDDFDEDVLCEAKFRFELILKDLLSQNLHKLSTEEHFTPDLITNFIILYGWFLYFTKGAIAAGAGLEKILDDLNEKSEEISWHKEVIFEFYVTILFKNCVEQPGSGIFAILNEVLERAIKDYPNNIFFLAILMKEQTMNRSLSQKWWKTKNLLLKSQRVLPILFLVLILNQKIVEFEESQRDSISGLKLPPSNALKNRMLSLFNEITKGEVCSRRCGLVWRLYLQFLHSYFSMKKLRDTYYVAVEELPWLKALYIDAAIYIPEELAQIQDLIIEKELRIHVTPEELDILRS